MGKQLNKEIKRKRRLARVKRQKEATRALKANPTLAKAKRADAKAAPKKKAAPRKAVAKKVEAAAEGEAATAEA